MMTRACLALAGRSRWFALSRAWPCSHCDVRCAQYPPFAAITQSIRYNTSAWCACLPFASRVTASHMPGASAALRRSAAMRRTKLGILKTVTACIRRIFLERTACCPIIFGALASAGTCELRLGANTRRCNHVNFACSARKLLIHWQRTNPELVAALMTSARAM
jgi:hypothetical protein